jgi:hypothetical protein
VKQDVNETRSKEIKGHQNPNLLDMSLLPLNAMTLMQQLLASLFDKGKATEVEPQMKQGVSGAEAKQDDVLESSAHRVKRGLTQRMVSHCIVTDACQEAMLRRSA